MRKICRLYFQFYQEEQPLHSASPGQPVDVAGRRVQYLSQGRTGPGRASTAENIPEVLCGFYFAI